MLRALVAGDAEDVMDRVVEDHAPVVVTRQSAESVVMVSLTDWNAMEATMHLMASRTNASRLMDSIAEMDADDGVERDLIET